MQLLAAVILTILFIFTGICFAGYEETWLESEDGHKNYVDGRSDSMIDSQQDSGLETETTG